MSVLDLDFVTVRGAFTLALAVKTDARRVALLGPNGAGKTTALRTMLGLVKPRRGRIAIADRVLFDADTKLDVAPEDRAMGYVPQEGALFPHLTALENVCFGLNARHIADSRTQARAVLEQLGCAALADRRPAELSGGERQRIAVARAVAIRPALLVLDEPLAALDVGARREARTFLKEQLGALGIPSLMVTHEFQDARALADLAVVLERGKVVQVAEVEELRRNPATPFVRELVGAND